MSRYRGFDTSRWAHDLEHPLVVRINLSALQLEEVSFLPGVDEAVRVAGVRPELICAEITESVWLRGTEAVRVNLDGLRDRGIGVAIDDFGTGFASLTYLRQYPVSVLKIDSSFVANIATDERDARLVSGLIALALPIRSSCSRTSPSRMPDPATWCRRT